jgi:hypothetical protein
LLFTLIAQKGLGGFPKRHARHWFFYPLISWFIVLLFNTIEALFGGNWIISDFLK